MVPVVLVARRWLGFSATHGHGDGCSRGGGAAEYGWQGDALWPAVRGGLGPALHKTNPCICECLRSRKIIESSWNALKFTESRNAMVELSLAGAYVRARTK